MICGTFNPSPAPSLGTIPTPLPPLKGGVGGGEVRTVQPDTVLRGTLRHLPTPTPQGVAKGRIAVMFEASGIVRDALIARGYDAVSIDERPTQRPGPHIVGDVFEHLNDGWSGAIMHPTCTYVCGSGFHWNNRVPGRNLMTDRAVAQFAELMQSPIPRIIAENPVGVLSTRYRKPTGRGGFTVQPYELGEDASKRTCFWIAGEGAPSFVKDAARRFDGRKVEWPRGSGKIVERWSNQTDSGQNALTPADDRWSARSQTYPGVADMLADTFGEWLAAC